MKTVKNYRSFNDASAKVYFYFTDGTTQVRRVSSYEAIQANRQGIPYVQKLWAKYEETQRSADGQPVLDHPRANGFNSDKQI